MGYVSTRKTLLQTRLARVQSVLSSLYDTLDEAAATNTSSYKFDSGEGSQAVTRKSNSEIQDMIERYEAEEIHYINELYNMGVMTIQLRRKIPC